MRSALELSRMRRGKSSDLVTDRSRGGHSNDEVVCRGEGITRSIEAARRIDDAMRRVVLRLQLCAGTTFRNWIANAIGPFECTAR
jgi:hypothetical protein